MTGIYSRRLNVTEAKSPEQIVYTRRSSVLSCTTKIVSALVKYTVERYIYICEGYQASKQGARQSYSCMLDSKESKYM